jgi:hypothetical protein
LLFVVLGYLLYKQIIQQPDLEVRWLQIKNSWKQPLFWVVVIMLLLNWGIEALKWQLLLSPLEKINFSNSLKSVFAGCSITMLTPNRTGEFGGRILFVSPENRIKAISATIVGSISQLTITIIIGVIAILNFTNATASYKLIKELPWIFNQYVLVISILTGFILLMIFFRLNFLVNYLVHIPGLKKISQHILFLNFFNRKILLRILFYSLLRYLVFILQYIFLLQVLHVEIDGLLCFGLLSIFYLAMAILPTIGFTELPVRATTSVLILGLFSENVLGIQAAAFGIWIINLIIPSIIGSLNILVTKIYK